MTRAMRLGMGCVGIWGSVGTAVAKGEDAVRPETGRVQIVSSSHQDTAWMDTPDFCRRFRVEQNIVPALEMMNRDPDYCFAMECALHLMEFLEAHPERRDEVVRRMREGRLEFGATYNQPYESYLSGEELVRQTYYGRRWIRTHVPGCDARVAYNPDVPGRALQMQQILAKAGIPYLFISRYHEGLYRWRSPDGSGVLAYTPGHYGNHIQALELPTEKALNAVGSLLKPQVDYGRRRDIPPLYALVNSMDFSKPRDFRPLIAAWNGQAVAAGLPPMAYGSMLGFFKGVDDERARIDPLMGERPDVWLYIHGPTHHWTTSLRREAARLLPAAEAFTTFVALMSRTFMYYPAKELDQAWMDELYIDHGIGGKNGHITDEVFHRKVLNARDTARTLLDRAMATIASLVRTNPGLGVPVLVFNDLSWARSGPVEWRVPDELASEALRVTDAAGREVPAQTSTLEAPEEVNVAAAPMGATARASSEYGAAYGAARAIDGRWDVRDPDPALGDPAKWNSAEGKGPHELVVDFGQPRVIHKVVIRHEGVMGAFKAESCDNTADFRVQGADGEAGPWRDLVPPVEGNRASLTVHTFAPSAVRLLRLLVTKGTQADNRFARIYEVQAFAKAEKKPQTLVFVAPDVPPLGYKTFYVSKSEGRVAAPATVGDGAENRFYRLSFGAGGLRSLVDKEQGRELLRTGGLLGGELFTLLSVAADNRGRGTDAGEFGAVPMPVMDDSFSRAGAQPTEWRLLEAGAARTVYGFELPWKNATVRERVTLWNALKRVDCEVELVNFNGELWREFRLAFPLALESPEVTYEVPMGVVRIGRDEIKTTGGHAYGKLDYYERCPDIRPREVQNFVDVSDGKGGVTLSTCVSVFDWKNIVDTNDLGVVLQPVLLATRKSCNGAGNWYPQAGDHRYRFSLTSHKGDWRAGWRAGVEGNHPLEAVRGEDRAPTLALQEEHSFLRVSGAGTTVSAVKKAEEGDGVVLRVVEMEGRDGRVSIGGFKPVREARRVSVIEDDQSAADLGDGSVALPLGHHAIETVRLQF